MKSYEKGMGIESFQNVISSPKVPGWTMISQSLSFLLKLHNVYDPTIIIIYAMIILVKKVSLEFTTPINQNHDLFLSDSSMSIKRKMYIQ